MPARLAGIKDTPARGRTCFDPYSCVVGEALADGRRALFENAQTGLEIRASRIGRGQGRSDSFAVSCLSAAELV
jgi:hypothetical protein